MKHYLFFLLLFSLSLFSQNGFEFSGNKKRIVLPFEMANNLIIIPVEVNNVKLKFLLDTGVEKSVLFSMDETDSLQFRSVRKIKITGLGGGEPIDALQSNENTIKIKNLIDKNHEIYVILDQKINFSSQLGIVVHGIIGFEFFKNFIVDINYQNRKIFVYKKIEDYPQKKIIKYGEVPLKFDFYKPYVNTISTINNTDFETKMLIDTGSSDAMWILKNDKITLPKKHFYDLLGHGFNGDIFGNRSRIEKFKIGQNEFIDPTTAFPDSLSINPEITLDKRSGSIGAEMLKKFNVIFDYKNSKMYLKPNSEFKKPFNYNMSGLEIQHNGVQWVQEDSNLKTKLNFETANLVETEFKTIKYKYTLKPVFEITYVRPNSPAELAGIQKGDKIIRIDGDDVYKFSLSEVNQLLQTEEGKNIRIVIERHFEEFKFSFKLKKIL
jgi:hypothetical protein